MNQCRLLCLVALIGVSLGSGCSGSTPESVASEMVVPVSVAPAVLGDVTSVIRATGIVTPAPGAELVVVAPEPARITAIPKGEGDRVVQGDLLVQFEVPAVSAEVARQRAEIVRAQAQTANAGASLTRARELFDRGVAARKEMEDAERDVAEAQANLAQGQASLAAAESALARATVRAPFNGVVIKRLHNPGDRVDASASDPVLRLVNPAHLEVTAFIPVGEVARVIFASAARVIGRDDLTMSVTSIPMATDPATGLVPVRLAFSRQPTAMAVGTPLQIEIDAEKRTGVVLVPSAAIVREGEDTAVMVATDAVATRRAVVLGVSNGGFTEVRSRLKAGEMVVIRGQAGLPDGAAIAVEAATP